MSPFMDEYPLFSKIMTILQLLDAKFGVNMQISLYSDYSGSFGYIGRDGRESEYSWNNIEELERLLDKLIAEDGME